MASYVTLSSANFLTAFLYLYLFKFLYLQQLVAGLTDLLILSIGLTVWWFMTMLPFVLVVTPLLIKAVSASASSIVPKKIRESSLNGEFPTRTFGLSLLIPGLILIILGLLTTFTGLGVMMAAATKLPTVDPLRILLYGSGVTLVLIGSCSLVKAKVQ